MPASLAETLYHAWRRAQHDITEHPAWGNLASEQRVAWERVAEVARIQPGVAGIRCVCGQDHMFEPGGGVHLAMSDADREALGDARAAVKLYRRTEHSAMTQSEHDRAVAVLDRLMGLL